MPGETVYTWANLFVRHLEAADERDKEAEKEAEKAEEEEEEEEEEK
jgi:hypothetical protein